MYYVYDKDGNQIKITHAIDYRTALATGRYTKLPPGVPEPEQEPEKPQGESVEGIVMEADKQPDKDANLKKQETPGKGKITRSKNA